MNLRTKRQTQRYEYHSLDSQECSNFLTNFIKMVERFADALDGFARRCEAQRVIKFLEIETNTKPNSIKCSHTWSTWLLQETGNGIWTCMYQGRRARRISTIFENTKELLVAFQDHLVWYCKYLPVFSFNSAK